MSTPKWEVSEMNGCGKSVAAIVEKPPAAANDLLVLYSDFVTLLGHSRFVLAKLTFKQTFGYALNRKELVI